MSIRSLVSVCVALALGALPLFGQTAESQDGSPKTPEEKFTRLSPQFVTPYHWFSVTGGAFSPTASGYSYYLTSGCLRQNAFANHEIAQYRAGVYLPDGATIKAIWYNYNVLTTTAGLSSNAGLSRQSTSSPSTADLISAQFTTTGVQGFSYRGGGEITSTVDNLNYAYLFYWNPIGTDVALCSLQVGYLLSTPWAYLPLIAR
jgi:hypothetical protein